MSGLDAWKEDGWMDGWIHILTYVMPLYKYVIIVSTIGKEWVKSGYVVYKMA